MALLDVGTVGCTFDEIYRIIYNSKSVQHIAYKLIPLAIQLDVALDVIDIDMLKMKMMRGLQSSVGVLYDILVAWRSRSPEHENAKLYVLINALQNVGLFAAADELQEYFEIRFPEYFRQHQFRNRSKNNLQKNDVTCIDIDSGRNTNRCARILIVIRRFLRPLVCSFVLIVVIAGLVYVFGSRTKEYEWRP